MEKSVRLKICSGDKRKFGDDITNLGPLIPLNSQEARKPAIPSIRKLKNPSPSSIPDENEQPVTKKVKKNYFAHEKFQLLTAMKNLRQFLNNS